MLYSKYRPTKFSDMVGQDHISRTLRNQIKTGQIAHSYLMCGTRGTGKTTSARIIAKAVNCLNPQDGEPCGECEMCKKIENGSCVDVIEMDAASNNSVDDIRRIIENVKYQPTEAKYKVFILDEAHMISNGGVNAFLKTLEEPPEKVIFILATTDPQKLPITIISRCQKFDFRRIKTNDIFNRLNYIRQQENFNIEENSLKLIAKVADGAMRDSLSILEQIMSSDEGNGVDYATVVNMLGIAITDSLFNLSNFILNKNELEALKTIDSLMEEGKDVNILVKDFTKHFRNLLMSKISNNPLEIIAATEEDIVKMQQQVVNISPKELMRIIEILQDTDNAIRYTNQNRTALELAVIKMCKKEYDNSLETIFNAVIDLKNQINNLTGSISNNSNPFSIAKNSIVQTLTKYNRQDIGRALSNSRITLDNKIINIYPLNKQEGQILFNSTQLINRAFNQKLNNSFTIAIK